MNATIDPSWAQEECMTRNFALAQQVLNRLDSVKAGQPLTAEEIMQGIRIQHAEYLILFDLAVEGLLARRAS